MNPLRSLYSAPPAPKAVAWCALLADPARRFTPRALTRKPLSPAALALAGRGMDVAQADLDDVPSLSSTFAGMHGVFAVTYFWEHSSAEAEARQARNVATAALRAGVKHVVWSTLEDTREAMPLDDPRMPVLMGRYKVPHMDAKGEANAVFREPGVPTTSRNTRNSAFRAPRTWRTCSSSRTTSTIATWLPAPWRKRGPCTPGCWASRHG